MWSNPIMVAMHEAITEPLVLFGILSVTIVLMFAIIVIAAVRNIQQQTELATQRQQIEELQRERAGNES